MLDALSAESGPHVSDLIGGHHWPSAIAWTTSPRVAISYVEFEPGLGFAEWRVEVLSLL